jgi:tetratricopeptide (TPR) repeat protein
MVAGMPPEFVKEAAFFVDGYMAMPLEVLMRFGRWEEILKEPDFADYLPLARTLRRYARGVSYAALGKLEEARAEEKAFEEARKAIAKDGIFGNNSAADIVALAEEILEGEILVASGKVDEGIGRLRKAVELEDKLRYDEPPDWIQPTRHALGAALLKADRAAEAQRVYEADLARLPGNVWGLYGLGRSLKAQKKDKEAVEVEKRFAEASAEADTKISSSCLCLPGV